MGSQNLYHAQTGEAIPFGYNRKHPCPRTEWQALIRGHGTFITASLYGVCFGKGLTTYWTIPCPLQGQVVVPTKGSYWTRLGLQPTQVIQVSTNNITTSEINHHSSSLTMLCRAYSSQRGIRDKLVSTQDHDFPASYRCAREAHEGDPILRVSIAGHKTTPKCTHARDYIIHKLSHLLQVKRCCDRIKTPQQILCQSSEMLAFKSMQRMHLLEAFLFLQKSYFAKYTNTNISNTVPKPVSNIFEINLKIN